MNLVNPDIGKYCIDHSDPPHHVLNELERETYLKMLAPQMLSGVIQGKFLSFITSLKKPKRILEIGTFTGYSTICFALSIPSTGHIDTCEVNEELEPIIQKYLAKAGVENLVQLHIGNALNIIPGLSGGYDLAFIDAGKMDYLKYFELILPKMNVGGLIIADNTLWSGKVAIGNASKDSRKMHAFNQKLRTDKRVDVTIYPFRDGITVATVL